VVGGVPGALAALVAPDVAGLVRGQGAQPPRRPQLAHQDVHHRPAPLGGQGTIRHGGGLVGAQAAVVSPGAVDGVVERAPARVPEAAPEAGRGPPAPGALLRGQRRPPPIALADLLNEVDRRTGCFRRLTRLATGGPAAGERKQHLLAAVMALGMNHGLGELARSTPSSYRQLAWAAHRHVREDTLPKAPADLDRFVLQHPLARHCGPRAQEMLLAKPGNV
jgi:hypothetical protein